MLRINQIKMIKFIMINRFQMKIINSQIFKIIIFQK